jgi:Na+/proline symporter
MKLTWLDISIVLLYLGSMVTIGWVLRKKARQNKLSYLMGGKSLPWYLLGLSDASDMFDISGTMWMVALCFIYGMKSIWIPWLYSLCLVVSVFLRTVLLDSANSWRYLFPGVPFSLMFPFMFLPNTFLIFMESFLPSSPLFIR